MISKLIHIVASTGRSNQSKNYGYLPHTLAFLCTLLWPLSWIYCNEHKIDMTQSTFIRGITNFVANYYICRYTNSSITYKSKKDFPFLIFRSIVITAGSLLTGISQFLLPLSIVHTLISSQILFVFIFDFLVNKVKVNTRQLIGIVIGMVGLILIANGRLIQSQIRKQFVQETKFENYLTDNIYLLTVFSLMFLVFMVFWSYCFVIIKNLTYNAFQFSYFDSLSNIFCSVILYQISPPSSRNQEHHIWYLLKAIIFSGIPLLFDQWFLNAAMIMCKKSGIIALISFNSVAIAYLVSIFRYQQKSSMIVNFGIVFLFFGIYRTLFGNNDKESSQNSSEGEDDKNGQKKEKDVHTKPDELKLGHRNQII